MNKSSTGARRLTVQELDSIFEYIVHECTAADFSHSAGVVDTKTGRDKVRTLAGDGEPSERLEALRSLTEELAAGVREGRR